MSEAKKDLSAQAGAENMVELENMEDIEPRIYELGYHVISSVSPEDLPKEAARVKEAIASLGGAVLSEEEPKLTMLAYGIAKTIGNKHVSFDSAYFGWVKFEAEGKTPALLKKTLDASGAILRFIIIKTVRENTLVRKSLLFAKTEKPTGKEAEIIESKRVPEESGPIDEEALNKRIEELVIQ